MRHFWILRRSGVCAVRYPGGYPTIPPNFDCVRHPWHPVSLPSHSYAYRSLAILTLVLPHYFNAFARSGLTNKHIRRFAADYGMPITIVAITGVAYWGRFNPFANEHDMTLPTTKGSFEPAGGREWLVQFWHLKGSYVGMAFPFGIVLWVLFYFDANVSALIAQDSEFPLRKPAAFHWDFFLLGVTTFIAGLLGVPAPNGLIPQAPLHTASLVVMGYPEHDEDIALSDVEEGYASGPRSRSPRAERSEALKAGRDTSPRSEKSRPARRTSTASSLRRRISSVSATAREAAERRRVLAEARREEREVPVSVVEQRVSNLAQGCLCLVLMTKPFEHVLGLIPKGVMAGLFVRNYLNSLIAVVHGYRRAYVVWFDPADALLDSRPTSPLAQRSIKPCPQVQDSALHFHRVAGLRRYLCCNADNSSHRFPHYHPSSRPSTILYRPLPRLPEGRARNP